MPWAVVYLRLIKDSMDLQAQYEVPRVNLSA